MINNELEHKFELKTGQNFNTFYKKYRPKLIWYLAKYTRDHELAEDFVDDAFTQALLKIDNFDNDKAKIHTWVYKIGENLVKKDFKDKKRMSVVSLDKESTDNMQLINIVPNGSYEEKNIMEDDKILIKKAQLVKEAIDSLPEKYKRVMVLRELENRPYVDIAEMCEKKSRFILSNRTHKLPSPADFKSLLIENIYGDTSHVIITYNEGKETTIQLDIEYGDEFSITTDDVKNVSKIEVIANGKLSIHYVTTTNLSTIKSQIGKGRQLIQTIVSKKFKILDDQGLH